MFKKFVPVNSDASPSPNPYEVRTYMGENGSRDWENVGCPQNDRICTKPVNSTLSKVLTIEDELRRLNQKAEESRFYRPFKKRCELFDEFSMCVMQQRSPEELKANAELRERLLLEKYDFGLLEHDAREAKKAKEKGLDLIVLDSPEQSEAEGDEEGEEEEEPGKVKRQLASPPCDSAIYLPDKRMLTLKRPKSRLYINETQVGPLEELPFTPYNPRDIQDALDAENLDGFDIIEGCNPEDLWTWNTTLQKRESDLDNAFIEAALPKYDEHLTLTTYNIPKDLETTFTAEIVFGNKAVVPERQKDQVSDTYCRPREIAAIYIAYVESFRLNPDFWTAGTMDGIIKLGDKLLSRSAKINFKSEVVDFDIIPRVPERLASIEIKLHYEGKLQNEPNIYKVLSLYFTRYNACILTTKNLHLLIWKRCLKSYYIFDPSGRNELCERDFLEGKCSLMATRFNEHLVHLVLKISDTDVDSDFQLYEINLLEYGKLTSEDPKKAVDEAAHKLWAVVNENFAVKPGGNSGIQQPISGNEKNASLVVSLIAHIYSEFERASTWKPITIDDLLRYGIAYYKTLRKKFRLDGKRWKNKKPHLNVVDLPEMFLMGAFKATVRKHPFLITGHVADCKNYLESQLIAALQQIFTSNEWPAILLQIDNSVLSLWRDNEFFYVFDPFRRNKVGLVVDPDDYRIKGLAMLQMHTTFDSFCRILFTNALKMRRGGKFFIHGIRVGCIRPLEVVSERKNKYAALQMGLPSFTDEPEPKAPEQKKSVQSIPDEDKIPVRDDEEIIDALINEIINSIIKDFPEKIIHRPRIYKQAQRVLLRSDKEHLRALRLRIKRGYDFEDKHESEPHLITLEEELQVPSNYIKLPDGVFVIFASSQMPQTDGEMANINGMLSGLVAIALASKYRISTWDNGLIDYALEAANSLGEEYHVYENLLEAVLAKRLPDISIGQNIYEIKVNRVIKSSVMVPLRQVLSESLKICSRLLIICQHFTCVIIKRYNFLYMFIGFPCNSLGFRKYGPGPACILRFLELDTLVNRIEFGCNPLGCEVKNFVVVLLTVTDTTMMTRFRKILPIDADAEYKKEKERRELAKQERKEKIRYIDSELKHENKRIQEFLSAKQDREDRKRDRCLKNKLAPYEKFIFDDEEEGLDEMGEEEAEETQIKHKPGKRLGKEKKRPYRPHPILYGYRLREKDCLFKIQGSLALEGREEGTHTELKICYFASAVAILNVILRPLNKWSSHRIDRVINAAKTIANVVCKMDAVFERFIRRVTVDDYEFDIYIRPFDLLGYNISTTETVPAATALTSLRKKLDKIFMERSYLMIFTPNGTYAIYHDEFFHLFDSYASMDKGQGEGEDEEDEETINAEEEEGAKKKKKHRCVKGPKRFPERNTASWVLFADVPSMLKYIDSRTSDPDWIAQSHFKFYVVDVLSYKKAARNERILQLLTDLSIPMECTTKSFGRPEHEICATNESLGWLELENCLPVWSRLNRRNTAGRYRNLPISKFKKFDVEIEGRLWSLWGNIHPEAPVFEPVTRGRQYLACYVMSCCAASIYQLMDWSPQVLDTIVISGDRYFAESIESIKDEDYEFSVEDLNIDCALENIYFVVHIEHVAFGKLYRVPAINQMNLSEALIYFFSHYQYGIVQVQKRAVAIGFTGGNDGGYFMYDCQEKDHPLFPKDQGASYLLRTRHLQVLLYCIVVTLNVPFYNIEFTIHKVEMLREGATVEEEGEEENEEI